MPKKRRYQSRKPSANLSSSDLKPSETHDPVDHPRHYNNHPSGVECIEIVEYMTFNCGNAVKDIWRSAHKNGLEDLKKARWYVDREIARISSEVAKGALSHDV
jgi:hypothetical protein